MLENQMAALGAVHSVRARIAEAIDLAAARLADGGRLIYLGAGTSGRIATQDAAELTPTFNWPKDRAISIMAGGNSASSTAIEGAEDNEQAAKTALDTNNLSTRDVVIGITASGRTPFTLSGLGYAKSKGALTIMVANSPLKNKDFDVEIIAQTGAEFLAGSTRLKAGTAQKVILNCLSTGIMIRLGFVYRGLMVEMQPTNLKLQDRAIRIVSELTGENTETARTVLHEADWLIKRAVVMLVKTCSSTEADHLLERGGGILRNAMGDQG